MKKLKTTRYMKTFKCTGPECEDHCCRAWTIPLDKADYHRLKDISGKNREGRALFKKAVKRRALEDRAPNQYAELNFNDEGFCRYMDAGLCVIHRDYGESLLPGACATYPRSLTEWEDQFILAGNLSCPEVARLCLLDAHSLDLEDLAMAELPERIKLKSGVSASINYYSDVGLVLEKLNDLDGFSLDERLYLLAYYTKKINPAFHRDLRSGQSTINRAGKRFKDERFLKNILKAYHDVEGPDEGSLQVLCLLLIARLGHERRKRYNELVLTVLATLGLDRDFVEGWDVASGPFLAPVWEEHRRRARKVLALFGARTELYFHQFCGNYILQEQFLNHPGPEANGVKLVLHMAIVKFLFFNHPVIFKAAEEERPLAEDVLDACFVNVVQVYMRNVSHNEPLFETLTAALNAREPASLSGFCGLLKV